MNQPNITSRPLVSFIINCYNGEHFLHKSIESILSQTYENWELIFWDNASTDNSALVFNSYQNPKFKYFKSEKNVTLGQARAWAVEKCNGEFIAFLDVDDTWLPDKTSIQVEGMISEGASFSYGGSIIEIGNSDNTRTCLPKYSSGYVFKNNLSQFEIQMPTAMISRQKLNEKKLNFDPLITASEEYCLFMQYLVDEKAFIVKKPIATYLIRKDSLTNQKIDRWAFERRYTLDKILQLNPNIINCYLYEFKEAYFRADYYEARYLMSKHKKIEARLVLKKASKNNIKYLILFLMTFFPIKLWEIVHVIKNHR